MADKKSSLVQIHQDVFDPNSKSLKVSLASGSVSVNSTTITQKNKIRLEYSTTNVTTTAWVELLLSVGSDNISEIEIFDSSGETLELGVGPSGSEVSQIYVVPGGNGRIPVSLSSLSRLSIKAVSATANSGEIIINLYG